MNFRLTLIAAVFWSMCAFSGDFAVFHSEIPGVQLWELFTDASGFPAVVYSKDEEDNDEFIRYCNGSRSIHVGSSHSPIRCKSEPYPPEGGSAYRIVLNTKDSRLSGPVVVSKKPLPGRVNALPVSDDEVKRLRKVEKIAKADLSTRVRREYGADMLAWLEAGSPKEEANYRKHWGIRYKLLGSNGAIYISPIGLSPDYYDGWDIRYAVFRETEGRFKKMGEISGCIGGFRDINGDGTPEVFTSECSGGGGVPYNYWLLTPTVRRVVSFGGSGC